MPPGVQEFLKNEGWESQADPACSDLASWAGPSFSDSRVFSLSDFTYKEEGIQMFSAGLGYLGILGCLSVIMEVPASFNLGSHICNDEIVAII